MAQGPSTPRQARRAALARRTTIQRDTAAEVLRQLREARARIARLLAQQPTDWQRWYLPQLDAQIQRVLADMQRGAAGALERGAEAAWSAGQALVDEPLRAGAGSATLSPAPAIDRRQLDAMKQFMTGRMRDISARVADKINAELGLVILGAQSPGEAIDKVARLLGAGAESRARALTIVRTELARAFDAAALERLKAAAEKIPGLKKQWRRSGKIHSRPQHDAIDGEVRDIDEPWEVTDPRTGMTSELMYPHDPAAPPGETINCGCAILPWKEDWEVARGGKAPFTQRELTPAELARNPVKAEAVAQARRRATR